VAASRDLVGVSVQMENEAAEACRRMGMDLGATPAEMTPRDPNQPGAAAQAACGAVGARIDAILRQGVQLQCRSCRPPVRRTRKPRHAATEPARAGGSRAKSWPNATPLGLAATATEPARASATPTAAGSARDSARPRPEAISVRDAALAPAWAAVMACVTRIAPQLASAQCQGYVQPPSAMPECNASCNAQADFQRAVPAVVNVSPFRTSISRSGWPPLYAPTCPLLLHAELALGKRLAGSARTVVNVGSALPRIVGNAGLKPSPAWPPRAARA